MRETSFIEQNKTKWDEFEKKFEEENDPEKVSNLFIQITDDLSYSRTYYPNRSVKIYLNNLAQRVFQTIYKNKIRRRKKFKTFWTDELPEKMFEARKQLAFTFVLFAISFLIGLFSSKQDPDFARFILGDDYIAMTEANIANDDPLAVYKSRGQVDMFLSITVNNLQVSFLALIFGIFFGLGTAYLVISNGIMVGVFQYFFIERGLFWESFLTIWVHGALEISAIVIAATAGITLGRGLLFPGTYTRVQSFRLHSARAIQIFLGVAPIIVLAGINESFLTRYTETPDIVRFLLIMVEFGFMLFYFVIYPWIKSKNGFQTNKRQDEIPADKTPDIKLSKIKTNGEIFSDSFAALRLFPTAIFKIVLFISAAYTAILLFWVFSFGIVNHNIHELRITAVKEAIVDVSKLLNYSTSYEYNEQLDNYDTVYAIPLFALNVVSLTLIITLSMYVLQLVKQKVTTFSYKNFFMLLIKRGWFYGLLAILLHSLMIPGFILLKIVFFLAIPAVFIISSSSLMGITGFIDSIARVKFYFKRFINTLLLYIPLIIISIMMACIGHSILCYINLELVKWNIPFNAKVYDAVQDITITTILMFTIFFQLILIGLNMGLTHFSINETETADELNERINTLTETKLKSKLV
jgi:uncharacterized membrane protein SpoIIM required for sporulation